MLEPVASDLPSHDVMSAVPPSNDTRSNGFSSGQPQSRPSLRDDLEAVSRVGLTAENQYLYMKIADAQRELKIQQEIGDAHRADMQQTIDKLRRRLSMMEQFMASWME